MDNEAIDEGTVEETPTEAIAEVPEESIDELPEEPTDNAERSNLGRKLKAEKERADKLEAKLAEIEERLTQRPLYQPIQQPIEQTTRSQSHGTPQRDPDEPITWGDIQRVQSEQQINRQRYQSSYGEAIAQFGTDLSEKEYADVISIATSPAVQQDPRRTGNPVIDAERHFLIARSAYEKNQRQKSSQPRNPLQESTPRNLGGASGTGSPSRQAPAKISASIMKDPMTASLVADCRAKGWSEEEIAKAVGDTDGELRGEISYDRPLNL